MNKLTLKHLAPYLPYGLQFKGKRKDWVSFCGETMILCPVDLDGRFDIIKPILRPLSDLDTVGCDIINEHSINLLIEKEYNLEYGIFSHYKGELNIELDGDPSMMYDSNKTISFDVIETIRTELFKAHFDVFGLIESGLALDINTL